MKRIETKSLSAAVLILLFYFFAVPVYGQDQAAGPEPAQLSLASVDGILAEKTVENCEKAIKGYEALLTNDPKNFEILYKLANAYIYIIDIKTAALIEEKDEYKPILKKLGKIANDYAQAACKLNPNSKEAVGANLVSYGYYSASFGIVKAIFKGAAGHYKDLGNQLIRMDDKYEGVLGYRSMGKLYHVAPWPVGSKSKALKYFKKAVETDNTNLFSHYFIGLIYFDDEKYNLAEKEFTFVRDNPPSVCEYYYIDVYKKRAADYLEKIAKINRKK